jgi:3'(2'), 5'-bisphosphate nucleotidase
VAERAAQAILEVYAQDFTSEAKSDGSPVTVADLAAHHIILDGLAALTPGVPMVSEESAAPPLAERAGWARHWLVDPLDGTREFIQRNGEFTVNIALIEDGAPVLGVVLAPALALAYLGQRGVGAYKRLADGSLLPLRCRTPAQPPAMVVSRSHREPGVECLLQQLGAFTETSVGSSLKFCQIAEGRADCYPKPGNICEWDTAAGQCVLVAAGGQVLALPTLEPLRYGGREDFRLPSFLAVGDCDPSWPVALAAGMRRETT